MGFKKNVFILGASSDIGISIMKIYLKNNYEILAHYNKGNLNFFNFVKNKKRIKLIKFNFLSTSKKIEKFLNKKVFKNYSIFINASAFLKEIDYSKVKLKDLEDTFKVNLYPGVLLTKIMGQQMNKRKWGRIVHLGSIGVKYGGGKKNFPYSFSKHALEFFPGHTKEWAKNNVLINTIRVGATNTKLHLNLPSKNLKKRKNLIPMGRMAEPREIAEFVYFLGSEENTYICNKVPAISGGE
tara:strand:+ start:11983 stop:12702 length:720 start_codon:yes stop_codon:yes gene_type:complete